MTFDLGISKAQAWLRRGWIIRILHYFRNEESMWVNDRVIQLGLAQNGHQVTIPTLLSDLQLLEEKGLVKTEQSDTGGVKVIRACLTADGVILHETEEGQPGVLFKVD